jgi:hypothetical protein
MSIVMVRGVLMEAHQRYALIDQLTRKLESAEESIRAIKTAAKVDRHTERVRAFTADFREALRFRRELETQLGALSCPLFYAL